MPINFNPKKIKRRAQSMKRIFVFSLSLILFISFFAYAATKGDVNDDGVINEMDIELIKEIILGTYEPTPEELWAADYNGDGNVNILDLQSVINIFNANLNFELIWPNGHEHWAIGRAHTIRWDPSIASTNLKIEISHDAGATWATLMDDIENDGGVKWTPRIKDLSSQCLLRFISLYDERILDQSSELFQVTLNHTAIKGDFNFDCSHDSTDINAIVSVFLNNPSIPEEFWIADVNDDGEINVLDIQTVVNWVLGLDFCEPTLQLITPQLGTLWYTNNNYAIQWQSALISPWSDLKLEISTDLGSSWHIIADSVKNTSPFSWIPSTLFISDEALLKVSTANCVFEGYSEQFSIINAEPTHFEFKTTDESYSIVVENVTLDGADLELGDEVGVFTHESLCVGANVWNGEAPLALAAWKDDPQTPNLIDGTKDGDPMMFRVWDAGSGHHKDYPANPIYAVGNGSFGYSIYSHISLLEAFSSLDQIVYLPAGWSWMSSHVVPVDLDVEIIMHDVDSLGIMVDCDGMFYIPNIINGIGEWNYLHVYKTYVHSADSLILRGMLQPFNTPIEIQAGWDCLPYLPRHPMPVDTACASIHSDLKIVKQDDGAFYIPDLINTIDRLMPGEGYKVYVQDMCRLIYPPFIPETPIVAKSHVLSDTTVHFEFAANTGESYSIVVDKATIQSELVEVGDEIAIYTPDSLCVGAVVFDGNLPIGLTAWKDDTQTDEIDGYSSNAPMRFRIWDASADQEYFAYCTYVSNDSTFECNFYSHLSLLNGSIITIVAKNDLATPEEFLLYQNYPNPFNPSTTIKFQMPKPSQIVMQVYNLKGQIIKTLINEEYQAGYHTAVWDATNNAGNRVSSGIYILQMKSESFSKTIKLSLLR
jgi:hypothetical protein